jgi:hypothetical protein
MTEPRATAPHATERRVAFEHDGHAFEAVERTQPGDGEPVVGWDVRMDGATVLEFRGEYPYRDEDVRKRVLEWYGIQKPLG